MFRVHCCIDCGPVLCSAASQVSVLLRSRMLQGFLHPHSCCAQRNTLMLPSKIPHAVSCPSALPACFLEPIQGGSSSSEGCRGCNGGSKQVAQGRTGAWKDCMFYQQCGFNVVWGGFFCCFLGLWVTAVKLMLLWESLSQKSLFTTFSIELLGTLRG